MRIPGWVLVAVLISIAPVARGADGAGAETLARSNAIIKLRVTLPTGPVIRVSVHDGEMARVTVSGKEYGLTPEITDAKTGATTVFLFEVRSRGKAGESLKQVDQLDLSPGGVETSKMSPFSIAIDAPDGAR